MSMRPVPAPATGGVIDALRAIGATLAELAHVRGALFAVELREEIARRRQMVVLALVGAVLLHMALALLTVFVTVLFWDSHRLAAIGAMVALYFAAGLAVLLLMRKRAAQAPSPFADSLRELGQDLAQLSPQR